MVLGFELSRMQTTGLGTFPTDLSVSPSPSSSGMEPGLDLEQPPVQSASNSPSESRLLVLVWLASCSLGVSQHLGDTEKPLGSIIFIAWVTFIHVCVLCACLCWCARRNRFPPSTMWFPPDWFSK